MQNFFKELIKSLEISLIGGNFKFHIDFTTTSNLLNLFSKKEEEAKKKEEEEEEEAKRKAEEEKEEQDWEDGKNPDLWEDDDDWD